MIAQNIQACVEIAHVQQAVDQLIQKQELDASEVYISDQDRESLMKVLARHQVQGYINLEEMQQRMQQTLSARTFTQLQAAVRNLPVRLEPPTAQVVAINKVEKAAKTADTEPTVALQTTDNTETYPLPIGGIAFSLVKALAFAIGMYFVLVDPVAVVEAIQFVTEAIFDGLIVALNAVQQ